MKSFISFLIILMMSFASFAKEIQSNSVLIKERIKIYESELRSTSLGPVTINENKYDLYEFEFKDSKRNHIFVIHHSFYPGTPFKSPDDAIEFEIVKYDDNDVYVIDNLTDKNGNRYVFESYPSIKNYKAPGETFSVNEVVIVGHENCEDDEIEDFELRNTLLIIKGSKKLKNSAQKFCHKNKPGTKAFGKLSNIDFEILKTFDGTKEATDVQTKALDLLNEFMPFFRTPEVNYTEKGFEYRFDYFFECK